VVLFDKVRDRSDMSVDLDDLTLGASNRVVIISEV